MQQEVLTDVHSFNRALIHVLRQDPDVIVVGEVRDAEAIATALTAAETGHLVLATMHSPNVAHALDNATAVAVELDDADLAELDAAAVFAPAPVE